MAFTEVVSLDCDTTIQIGGKDRKTGKSHPNQIEGYYLGSRSIPSAKAKSGFSLLHVFQTSGRAVGVWGKTDLDRKLSSTTLGTMTRVTFAGMRETRNNPMYTYKVEVDAENTIDVGGLAASAAESSTSSYEEEYTEETDPGEDTPAYDEVPPARAAAPRQPAAAPSADRQAKVKALLSGRKQA